MRNPSVSTHRVTGRTARFRGMLAVALLAGSAGLGACARDAVAPRVAAPDGPSFTRNRACAGGLGGVVHNGSVPAPETWTRANNPHWVDTFVSIDGAGVLTLQPG